MIASLFASIFLSLSFTAVYPIAEHNHINQQIEQTKSEIQAIMPYLNIQKILKQEDSNKSRPAKAYFALGAGAGLVMAALLYASFYGYADYQNKQQIKKTSTPDPENTEIPEEPTVQTNNQQQTEEIKPVSASKNVLQSENKEHIVTEQNITQGTAKEQVGQLGEQQVEKNIAKLKNDVQAADDQIIILQKQQREAESEDEKKKFEKEIKIADQMRIEAEEKRLKEEDIKRKKAIEKEQIKQRNYFSDEEDNYEASDTCIIS